MGRLPLFCVAGFLLVQLIQPCFSKVVQASHVLSSQKPWLYCSKFGFYQGTGSYSVRIRLSASTGSLQPVGNAAEALTLTLEAHLDEDWMQTTALPFCERHSVARKVRNVQVPLDGSWGEWVEGNPKQVVRAHVWYYAIQHCNGTAYDKFPGGRLRVDVEFLARQDGGSEFSVELEGTATAAAIRLALGTAFLAWYVVGCCKRKRVYGRLHDVLVVLFVAALAQYVSYAFQWRHLQVYRVNGQGVWMLDLLAEIFGMLAQIIVSAISIFLAKGYTVLPRKMVPWRTMLQAFLFVAATHVVIVASAKLWDDASFKFHANEGLCGVLLVILRLGLYGCFLSAIRSTYSDASFSLHLASAMQYLAYPVIFIVAHFFAPYLRHKCMLTGLFVMEAWSIGWYSRMFLTRGQYFDITTLDRNVLPTPHGSRRIVGFYPDDKIKHA